MISLKGDWAEFCHTFGMVQWNHIVSPCPFCRVSSADMYKVDGLSLTNRGFFPAAGHETWDAACTAAEIRVTVSRVDHGALLGLLEYSQRVGGGRILKQPYPPLGLRAGDRLEPCPNLEILALLKL